MMPILLVFFHFAFIIQFFQWSGTDFWVQLHLYQCGYCVLIGLFVALDPGMPRNQHQNQMFILTVDLANHFHNFDAVILKATS
jgi:hypothetical protein